MGGETEGRRRPRRSLSRLLATRQARGSVKLWHSEEGWGVITSPDVAGEVWVHFSAIEGSGYRELAPGAPVEFKYRQVHNQDGYSFVADSVRSL